MGPVLVLATIQVGTAIITEGHACPSWRGRTAHFASRWAR